MPALVVLMLATVLLGVCVAPRSSWAASRRFDPAQVLPLHQIDAAHRDVVAEVIAENSFHRQGQTDTFPANPKLYLALLNEPALTLALWQDLAPTPASLRQVGPGRYEGTDGAGATAVWQYVLSSPRLHVLYCTLDYASPHGATRLSGRIVMIVRTSFYKDTAGEPWIKHDLEAFVKIDSRGWKAVAVTVRPIIEKLLQEQVQEAGWFISLMARLVETYPDWAVGVTRKPGPLPTATREAFTDLVNKHRRPGAFEGRPQMVSAADDRARR